MKPQLVVYPRVAQVVLRNPAGQEHIVPVKSLAISLGPSMRQITANYTNGEECLHNMLNTVMRHPWHTHTLAFPASLMCVFRVCPATGFHTLPGLINHKASAQLPITFHS